MYTRAERLKRPVENLPAWMQAALDAFELSGLAVVLVDAHGDVLSVNRLAESIFDDDVYLVGGRIVSANPEVTARLDRALSLLSRTERASLPPIPILLPRKERRPILAFPTRLPCATVDDFALSHAMVVLVQLDTQIMLVDADLLAAFNLTRSEARLASQLVGGHSLRGAAASIGIAYESARKTLKSILYKTSTNRQTQLIALLCALAARRPCHIDQFRTPAVATKRPRVASALDESAPVSEI